MLILLLYFGFFFFRELARKHEAGFSTKMDTLCCRYNYEYICQFMLFEKFSLRLTDI